MKRNLLEVWYKRAEVAHKGHLLACRRSSRYNYYVGIPTILSTALVGTSVFASLSAESTSVAIMIATGILSMVAAVLSSLQTFLGFSERADRHRDAGVKYGTVGRKMELLFNEDAMPKDAEALALKKELDDLAMASPRIPLDILKGSGAMYTDPSLDFDVAEDTATGDAGP